ncbi:MAG: U32 family peptidase [Syntrophomonadaceae bacterium]
MNIPELVMPGGDLEKVKVAALFGADSVYLGGPNFSLRAYAGNLDRESMNEAVSFLHQRGNKAYITVNVIAQNSDLSALPAYLEELAALRPDSLIISDLGVMRLARRYAPDLPLTISTQANVCNYEAAAAFAELGAKRLVLARELTLDEIEEIRRKIDIELELFVHGAMCVAFSGRCLLSHYMTGRSANQGACAHPCRYSYALQEEKRLGQYFPIHEDQRGTYILNSRDLCLLCYIPQLIELGINAFKVEGRMKSPLYLASTAGIYRQAVDQYAATGRGFGQNELESWLRELERTATRPFTTAFIDHDREMQDIDKSSMGERAEFCGIVKGFNPLGFLEVEQRANFGPGDPLELLLPGGEVKPLALSILYDRDMEPIDRARHARQRVYIPSPEAVPEYSILRRIVNQNEQ